MKEEKPQQYRKFNIPGSDADYIGGNGMFRKVLNGEVFDMDRDTRTWVRVPQLSISNSLGKENMKNTI